MSATSGAIRDRSRRGRAPLAAPCDPALQASSGYRVGRCTGVALAVAALTACGSGGSGAADACFRVGYLDVTNSAPLYVAQAEGYFDSTSVCVRPEAFGTSNQLVDALAGDRIDYAVRASAVPALALAALDSTRLIVTAASTISVDEPSDALLVPRASGRTALSDLAGARIGVFPGTTATALLRHYLADRGVDVGAIEFIPTAPPNQLAALRSGAIDALHAYEPTWTVAVADSSIVELHGTVYGRQLAPNPQGVSLLNRRTAERRPEAARRLVTAFDLALRAMRTDEARTRRTLRAHFDLPGDAVERMHLQHMTPHDSIDWRALARYVALLQDVGELARAPSLTALRF